MKIPSLFFAASLLAGMSALAPAACAQVVTAAPIRITYKAPKDEHTFHGEVIAVTMAAITVRNAKDPRRIRTFSYTPAVTTAMRRIMQRGGYQAGDKVEIRFHERTDEAYSIKGKPSSPR